MEVLKEDMEEECRKLQDNLRELMEDRSGLLEEFIQLNGLQKKMMVQLRDDTLAGEGQLLAFQIEKTRVEARLEQLEEQMKDKNDKLMALDAKASEYLLKVTTASNTMYDDEDYSEHNESQKNLIQRLVTEELLNDEGEGSEKSAEGSATEDASVKNISSLRNDDSLGAEGDVSSDNVSEVCSDDKNDVPVVKSPSPPTKDQILSLSTLVSELKRVKDDMGRCISAKEESFLNLEHQLHETKRELASLRGSMSDVSFGMRSRDDDTGSYDRIGDITKTDIEKQVSDLQETAGHSSLPHEEKINLLQKIEILESMIEDDHSNIEVGDSTTYNLLNNRSRGSRDFGTGLLKPSRTPSVSNSISEKVAMLERDLDEANNRLRQSHDHIMTLSKEKEYKQKECELLQEKVNKVEAKMNELQGTFDALIKTMMSEREGMVKELENKTCRVEEMDQIIQATLKANEELKISTKIDMDLYMLKVDNEKKVNELLSKQGEELKISNEKLTTLENQHSNEVRNLKQCKDEMESFLNNQISELQNDKENDKLKLECELQTLKSDFAKKEAELQVSIDNLKSENSAKESQAVEVKTAECLQLQNENEVLKESIANLRLENQSKESSQSEIHDQLQSKSQENEILNEKIRCLEIEISDFAPQMKEEMSRLKDELIKMTEDKANVECTFFALQEDHKEILQKSDQLSLKIEQLEREKLDCETLNQQVEELNAKHVVLSSEMFSKDEENQEELNAREATIQELRITLTNNQKQSKENYQMLLDDIAALNIKHNKEKDENQALISHLKEKCLNLESEGQQKQQEIDIFKNEIENLKQEKEAMLPAAPPSDYVSEEESVQTTDKGTSIESDECETPLTSANSRDEAFDPKDFKTILSQKEESISELSNKVQELEASLQQSASKESSKEASKDELLSRFEAQMKQIAELNQFISDLKQKVDQLTGESNVLKDTVDQLRKEKESCITEKCSLEQDLKQLKASQNQLEAEKKEVQTKEQELETELGAKRNLVEGLHFKLKQIEGCVLDYPCAVEISLIDRLDMLGTFFESKISEKNEKSIGTINDMGNQIRSLNNDLKQSEIKNKHFVDEVSHLKEQKNVLEIQMKEMSSKIDDLQANKESIEAEKKLVSDKLSSVEKEFSRLKEDKRILAKNYEKEQRSALEMQNQMVSDLERLILNLESEKKELDIELKSALEQLQSSKNDFESKMNVLRESISLLEKERDVLRMEIKRLENSQKVDEECGEGFIPNESLSLIENLTGKVGNLRNKLEEAQASLEERGSTMKERLVRERSNHAKELSRLRNDLRDELDILEQQKEELRQDFQGELAKQASEWAKRLETSEREKSLQVMDEKAQFGRVLVGKNDEYEKLVEEKSVEVSGYQARLQDLQVQLEEKCNMIDELEINIDELVTVRNNLEDKLSDLSQSYATSSSDLNLPCVRAPMERDDSQGAAASNLPSYSNDR